MRALPNLLSFFFVMVFLLLANPAVGEEKHEVSMWLVDLEAWDGGKYKVRGSVFAIGDPVHETLTLQAFKNVKLISADAKRESPAVVQVMRGVFWNDDPCSQLFADNDYAPLQPSFGIAWYLDFIAARKLSQFKRLSCPLLGLSHFGELQFLHSMASKNGVDASITREEILNWAEVMYKIAVGEIDVWQSLQKEKAAQKLPSSILNHTPAILFGAKTESQIRARGLGSLLHMLQDSFARGHVTRIGSLKESNLKISQFLCFKDQNEKKHAHEDGWRSGSSELESALSIAGAEDALNVSTQIAAFYKRKASWDEVRRYLKDTVLATYSNAVPSGPGSFR